MERKSEAIILRVTKKEKESLISEAKKKGRTLSRYLVESRLEEEGDTDCIPQQKMIEMIDFLNEIYHKALSCGNEKLKMDIEICSREKLGALWGMEK